MKGFLTKKDWAKINSVQSQLQVLASLIEEAVLIFATSKPMKLVRIGVEGIEKMHPQLSFQLLRDQETVFVSISKKEWSKQAE